jgi:Na+-translocating ferredoxin:NAD+ oxidoreductase subunit G
MMMQSIGKNSLILAAFAAMVAAGIASTELATRNQREESVRKVQSMALQQLMPAELHDNILLDDPIQFSDTEWLKLPSTKTGYIARLHGKTTAFIIPIHAPDGYSGSIYSLVSIKIDGTILGVRVISHNETPGLGDKIEIKKSPWILSFIGKSLTNTHDNEWSVKKDHGVFDQFTGATITPRAVVQSVHHALLYFNKHRDKLMAQSLTPEGHTHE